MKTSYVIKANTSNEAAFSSLGARAVRRYAGRPARRVVTTRRIDGRPVAGQVGAVSAHPTSAR